MGLTWKSKDRRQTREQETRRFFFAVRRKANCCLIVCDFQAKRKTRIKLNLGYQVKLKERKTRIKLNLGYQVKLNVMGVLATLDYSESILFDYESKLDQSSLLCN
jgi:hypothetical protein